MLVLLRKSAAPRFTILGATILFAAFVANFILGCTPKTVGDAIREYERPEFSQEVETINHKIKVRLIPEDLYYLAFGGLDTNLRYSQNLLDQLKKNRASDYGLTFFFTISPRLDTLLPTDFRNDVIYGQLSGNADYRVTLQEFQFGLQSKIWLEVDGKKYEMRNYHMNQTLGLTKGRTFSLMFDNPEKYLRQKKTVDVVLVAEEIVPGQGRTRFRWKVSK